ncbi:hypothetical protein K491DRAFT_503985 [Lophiostoma macrostomum CBS 122681]|uniref:CoA-dependent acyltransferase n=1 Tax=Lophiostoma macrostomum CBS 122681 TaxID=1314788 RepID=A0A6A6TLJ6_9PLEO|nr:hypothetical protein K491DRAFT_503985 [Lophiostoma macrostomum CBS 122681]
MTPWQRKSEFSSTFARPIGVNESFIKLIGDAGHAIGREHWAIHSTASIVAKGSLPGLLLTRLRYAWRHLRFQHPSLAAYVGSDQGTLVYDIPSSEEDLEAWFQETFKVEQNAPSASELLPMLRPSRFATLCYVVKSGELLAYTSHWRNDGLGVVILLDSLLRLLVAPDLSDPTNLPWGDEVLRLSPCVEDAIGISENPTADQQALAKACVDTFALMSDSTGIPYEALAPSPLGTLEELITLEVGLTGSIIDAARDKGVDVKAAVHASVAAANWDRATEVDKTKHYASTIRVSLRPYLAKKSPPATYASGLYTTGWMDKVEPSNGWLSIANHYHSVYEQGISNDYIQAHGRYAGGLLDMVRNLPPDLPAPTNVDISVIDGAEDLLATSYGSGDLAVDVKGMTVGVDMLSPQVFCFMWLFRERLNISVVYNQAYHAQPEMREFLESVRRSLLDGLEVYNES